MPLGWAIIDDGSWDFSYQPDLLYGVEPNDTGLENDNAQNVSGDDTDMQWQPSYPDFSKPG